MPDNTIPSLPEGFEEYTFEFSCAGMFFFRKGWGPARVGAEMKEGVPHLSFYCNEEYFQSKYAELRQQA